MRFAIIYYHVVGIFTIGTEKVLMFASDFSAVSFDSGDTSLILQCSL